MLFFIVEKGLLAALEECYVVEILGNWVDFKMIQLYECKFQVPTIHDHYKKYWNRSLNLSTIIHVYEPKFRFLPHEQGV